MKHNLLTIRLGFHHGILDSEIVAHQTSNQREVYSRRSKDEPAGEKSPNSGPPHLRGAGSLVRGAAIPAWILLIFLELVFVAVLIVSLLSEIQLVFWIVRFTFVQSELSLPTPSRLGFSGIIS
jgi:hypothetical protein